MKIKCIILLIATVLHSSYSYAEMDIYSYLSQTFIIKDNFEVVRTKTGIDLFSIDKFTNSKGKIESVTHLMIEGPLNYAQINDLKQALFATAEIVKPEVDENYTSENEIYPGLGVDIVDINGVEVGILNYKMNHEPNTYVKRSAIYTKSGIYLFDIIMHQSEPNSKAGLTLFALLIAAVNSGKL